MSSQVNLAAVELAFVCMRGNAPIGKPGTGSAPDAP